MKSSATIRLVEVIETVPPKEYFGWYNGDSCDYEQSMLSENELGLIAIVLRFYSLTFEDIVFAHGLFPRPEARGMCWMLLNDIYGSKNSLLATYFKREHSTINYGIRTIRAMVKSDKEVKERYEQILKLI